MNARVALIERMPMKMGQGAHLIAEWCGCDASIAAMLDAAILRSLCIAFSRSAGLQIVGDAFHQFSPHGVTGTVLLAESHLAIHTWPESGYVTLDVYVCNLQCDNTEKALALYAALKQHFQPRRTHYTHLHRGQ